MTDPTETHTAHPTALYVFRGIDAKWDPIAEHEGQHCTIVETDVDGETGKHWVRFADGTLHIAFADELFERADA